MLLSIEFAWQFAGPSGGRIINLTSGQGRGAMPSKLAYAATKGAIEAFTITLAVEVAPRGITVNAVDPGPTDTGWMTEEVKRELLPRCSDTIGAAECIDGPVCSSLDSNASRSASRHPSRR